MRQVYRLLGLVRRHGADRVELACRRALDAEAINVGLIERMLARGLEAEAGQPGPAPPRGDRRRAADAACRPGRRPAPAADTTTVVAAAGRFVRDPVEFAARTLSSDVAAPLDGASSDPAPS